MREYFSSEITHGCELPTRTHKFYLVHLPISACVQIILDSWNWHSHHINILILLGSERIFGRLMLRCNFLLPRGHPGVGRVGGDGCKHIPTSPRPREELWSSAGSHSATYSECRRRQDYLNMFENDNFFNYSIHCQLIMFSISLPLMDIFLFCNRH